MGQSSRKPNAEDHLQNSRRCLARSIREVERESTSLDALETQLRVELKRTAEKGDLTSAKILASDIARTRKTQTKLYEMKSHLRTMALRLQSVKSSRVLSSSLQDVAQTLLQLNVELNLPGFQQLMESFLVDADRLDSFDTLINTGFETLKKNSTEVSCESEAERIYSQVLEEIGLDSASQLHPPPSSKGPDRDACVVMEEKKRVPLLSTVNPDPVLSGTISHRKSHPSYQQAYEKTAEQTHEKSLEERLRLLNIF